MARLLRNLLTGSLVAALSACTGDGPSDDRDDAAIATDAADDTAPGSDAGDDTADAEPGDEAETSVPDAERPDDDAPDAEPDEVAADGEILGVACVAPSRAVAARVPAGAMRLEGPAALGGQGDFLLMNDRAAFVIQGMHDPRKTYWYYVGQPIDAVALDDCFQTTPDRFDELGVILGSARIDSFFQSSLRGMSIDTIEVISDGTDGGPAHVRATGTDDFFWLIELELIRRAFTDGSPRGYSAPLGIAVTVDYYLQPQSAMLEMAVTIHNTTDERRGVFSGLVNFFGDTSVRSNYVDDALSLGGLSVDVGVPWIVSLARDHAMAIAIEGARTGLVSISGVDAMVNIDQFLLGANIAPGGTRTDTYLITVGEGGINSAIAPLHPRLATPIPPTTWSLTAGSVTSVDEAGRPIPGVEIVVEQLNRRGEWRVFDGFYTDNDGRFERPIAALNGKRVRLRALAAGRAAPEPVELLDGARSARFAFGPQGAITVQASDGDGTPMPAKVLLWDGDRIVARAYTAPAATTIPAPPGTYGLTVSRGFEFEVYDQPVTIPENDSVRVDVTLQRVVDTTGYLSADGHVHGGPSPDSSIPVPMRAISVAAEGVEVAVSTDHEALIPWFEDFVASGMRPYVATVLGQEVTAPIPEHSNAYPFPARTDEGQRGVPVDWRLQDMAGLFRVSRERGAQVVALNHPRNGCAWMCIVGYDRVAGDITLEDPTLLGYPADAQLWSWDFDTHETLNGHTNAFVDPDRPDATGTFDDWISFINHGHGITATGVTDTHGLDAEGSPRTFFVAPTDDPAAFEDGMLVDAMLQGRALVSTGGFARVNIGDASMGDTVTSADGHVDLHVQVSALPAIDVVAIQVFANCDEVAWIDVESPDAVTKFSGTIPLSLARDAHIVVVAHGTRPLPRPFPQFDAWGVPRVITNPIYVDVGGDGYVAPGGKTCEYRNPRVVRPKRTPPRSAVEDAIPTLHGHSGHACPCH